FLHHGTGESKKDRRVGRLTENICANSFGALAPFVDDAGGETDNHKNQNDLDGNRKNAEDATQGTRGEIAPEHLEERKGTFVGIGHEWFRRENCTTRDLHGSKKMKRRKERVRSTHDAEVQGGIFLFH